MEHLHELLSNVAIQFWSKCNNSNAWAVKALTAIMIASVWTTCYSAAAAGAQGGTIKNTASIDGMTQAEFEDAAKAAMPLPILRLMRWRTLGRNNYAIEMSLVGITHAPQPAMHVTFHTSADADRSVLLKAIAAAGAEARALMKRLALRP